MLHFEQLECRRMLAAWVVKQTPRVQLGNAPLVGFAGSDQDQIEILWQTIPAEVAGEDQFSAQIRPATGGSWRQLAEPLTIETGIEDRIIHSVVADDLDFGSAYEYRVQHLRDGMLQDEYQHVFRTRLAPQDTTPFSFAQYGDSASPFNVASFELVNARLNQLDPAFTLLSGDNIYTVGTHEQADVRFDPTVSPQATEYIATHVDYFNIGDHEMFSFLGLPSRESFSTPIPVAGVNAPFAPPESEFPEHNYSFDYGTAHFLSLDTNSFNDPPRLAAQLEWAVQDLNASDAMWKVVFAHHPIAGIAEDEEEQTPADDYYQQIMGALGPNGAGVDLFLVGNSHAYGWTYPLIGEENGEATFDLDTDRDYEKGAGLVQVTAGVGGHSLRSGNVDGFPFVVAGFTSETTPPSEYGFSLVDVSSEQLVVSYVSAETGNVIDQFSITAPPDTTGPQVVDVVINEGLVDPPDLPAGEQPTSWAQQRSLVRNIVVDFDEPIGDVFIADIAIASLGVNPETDPATPIDLDGATVEVQGSQLRIQLPTQHIRGVLELTLRDSITDLAGNNMASDHIHTGNEGNGFFGLVADWNGDGGISIFDFASLSYWFAVPVSTAPEYIDCNGDSGIGIFDFPCLAQFFGLRLELPAAKLETSDVLSPAKPTDKPRDASSHDLLDRTDLPLGLLGRLELVEDETLAFLKS